MTRPIIWREQHCRVVTLTYADEEINELHGHTAQMNAVYMRDSITPLDKSRKLPVSIETSAIP